MSASDDITEPRTYEATTIIHDIPPFVREKVWRATDPLALHLDDVVEDTLTDLLDVTDTLTADLAELW